MQNQQHSDDRAELEAHFAERVQAYRDMGMTSEEATRQAAEKFGSLASSLRQLRIQYYLIRPLKAVWSGIYLSAHMSLHVFLPAIAAYGLLSYSFSTPFQFLDLFRYAPIMVMASVANRREAQASRRKHWEVLGAALLWMSLYLISALFSYPNKKEPDSQTPWFLLLGLIIAAYIPISGRKNAKPRV